MADNETKSYVTYLAVIIIRLIYCGMYMLTKISFNVGMSTFIFVFYRQLTASLFLAPIAIFCEWKKAPPFSFIIFVKLFLLALVGITICLDVYGVAVKYTGPTLASATTNSIPVITLFLALIFGLEKLNLKRNDGMLKLAGIVITIGGILTIVFFKGRPYIHLVNHPIISFHGQKPNDNNQVSYQSTWTKGVLLMLVSNISWSCWLIFQGNVLNSYPSKLLLTTWLCVISTFQSFIVAISIERNIGDWKLDWDITLISIAYCGIVVTGITYYLQAWIIEKRGPVFYASTTPLSFMFTLLASEFLLVELTSLGSILGALFLVGGLCCVLWGKSKEKERKQLTDSGQES